MTVQGSDDLQEIGDTKKLDGDTAEARARATPFGLGGGLSGGVSLPSGVGSSGPLHGADPRLKKYADVAARFGLVITAGRDDHSVNTSTGNRSLHADGHALDFGAPGWPSPEAKKKLLDFAEYASKTWGAQLEELIHTPLGGRQINDGAHFVYTGITAQQHYNHVHLADVNPGGEDAGPPSGDPGGGGGLPGGGGFGFGLDVHLVRWDGQGGRTPDVPGVPSSVPENLRAMLYNIMLCESSGNPRAIEPPGGNGGALGHYGLFQFDIPTWESVGGSGNPIDASPEEQWMRAVKLYQSAASAVGVRRRGPPRLQLSAGPSLPPPVLPSGRAQGPGGARCRGSDARRRAGGVRRAARTTAQAPTSPPSAAPTMITVPVAPAKPDQPCNGEPGVEIPALEIPELRTNPVRVPEHELDGHKVAGFVVPGIRVPAQHLPAQCAKIDPAPAGCLGRVTIPSVEIPAVRIPAQRIPGVDVPGASVAPVVAPAVTHPAVVAPAEIEEQVCRQKVRPGEFFPTVFRANVYRPNVYPPQPLPPHRPPGPGVREGRLHPAGHGAGPQRARGHGAGRDGERRQPDRRAPAGDPLALRRACSRARSRRPTRCAPTSCSPSTRRTCARTRARCCARSPTRSASATPTARSRSTGTPTARVRRPTTRGSPSAAPTRWPSGWPRMAASSGPA